MASGFRIGGEGILGGLKSLGDLADTLATIKKREKQEQLEQSIKDTFAKIEALEQRPTQQFVAEKFAGVQIPLTPGQVSPAGQVPPSFFEALPESQISPIVPEGAARLQQGIGGEVPQEPLRAEIAAEEQGFQFQRDITLPEGAAALSEFPTAAEIQDQQFKIKKEVTTKLLKAGDIRNAATIGALFQREETEKARQAQAKLKFQLDAVKVQQKGKQLIERNKIRRESIKANVENTERRLDVKTEEGQKNRALKKLLHDDLLTFKQNLFGIKAKTKLSGTELTSLFSRFVSFNNQFKRRGAGKKFLKSTKSIEGPFASEEARDTRIAGLEKEFDQGVAVPFVQIKEGTQRKVLNFFNVGGEEQLMLRIMNVSPNGALLFETRDEIMSRLEGLGVDPSQSKVFANNLEFFMKTQGFGAAKVITPEEVDAKFEADKAVKKPAKPGSRSAKIAKIERKVAQIRTQRGISRDRAIAILAPSLGFSPLELNAVLSK